MKKIIIVLLALLVIAGCGNKNKYDLAEKTFYNTVDQYGNAEHSNVWLGKDGSFVLIENTHEGYNQFLGKWEIKENVITLNVENSDVSAFKTIIFEVKDDNTLTLKTGLSSSKSNDTYTTDKTLLVNDSNTSNTNTGQTNNKKAKKFINASQMNQMGNSYIEFFDDGTFQFTEIEGMGAEMIEGLWSMMGNAYALSNFKGDVYDRDGNKLYNLVFEVRDEKTIQLLDNSKVSYALDYFTTDGKLDESYLGHGGPEIPIELYDEKWTHEDIPDTASQFYPTLELFKDGTFVFTENVYAGMAQYKGTYTRDSVGIYCDVVSHNLQGFAGQDVTSFSFSYKSANEIYLDLDLCMSRAGDIFHK